MSMNGRPIRPILGNLSKVLIALSLAAWVFTGSSAFAKGGGGGGGGGHGGGGGTISRHIICSGQLFAQFFRGHPEELPEAQRGQLQAQEAVRRLILSVPGPELV